MKYWNREQMGVDDILTSYVLGRCCYLSSWSVLEVLGLVLRLSKGIIYPRTMQSCLSLLPLLTPVMPLPRQPHDLLLIFLLQSPFSRTGRENTGLKKEVAFLYSQSMISRLGSNCHFGVFCCCLKLIYFERACVHKQEGQREEERENPKPNPH